MSTADLQRAGHFGPVHMQCTVRPDAPPEELLFDVLCLLDEAHAVLDGIASEGHDVPGFFGGLFLVRQALIGLRAIDLIPTRRDASTAGG